MDRDGTGLGFDLDLLVIVLSLWYLIICKATPNRNSTNFQ
jgi:hypothetical protein